MQITITTRCNMTCAHCAYSCTSDGRDMDFPTFKRCLKYAKKASITGGEPTIHPEFWRFLEYALDHCKSVWVATNGSQTETALKLAKMAQEGIIDGTLSQDEWHDPIDPKVFQAFGGRARRQGRGKDRREIRNVAWNLERGPQKAGRCWWGVDLCPCEMSNGFVKVDGDIFQCGCDTAPLLGTVFSDRDLMAVEKIPKRMWVCYKREPFVLRDLAVKERGIKE